MTPTLVFDIETVPDVAGLRRVHRLPATLSDAAVLTWACQQGPPAGGRDFLAWTSLGWVPGESVDPEPGLTRPFFDGVDPYTPQLVSWNGSGFDLPVLSQRALILA